MISDEAETCFGCGYQVSVPQTYSVTLTQPEQAFQVGEQELPLNEQIRRMQIADNVIQEVFKFISSADDKKETAGKIAGYGKKTWVVEQ